MAIRNVIGVFAKPRWLLLDFERKCFREAIPFIPIIMLAIWGAFFFLLRQGGASPHLLKHEVVASTGPSLGFLGLLLAFIGAVKFTFHQGLMDERHMKGLHEAVDELPKTLQKMFPSEPDANIAAFCDNSKKEVQHIKDSSQQMNRLFRWLTHDIFVFIMGAAVLYYIAGAFKSRLFWDCAFILTQSTCGVIIAILGLCLAPYVIWWMVPRCAADERIQPMYAKFMASFEEIKAEPSSFLEKVQTIVDNHH